MWATRKEPCIFLELSLLMTYIIFSMYSLPLNMYYICDWHIFMYPTKTFWLAMDWIYYDDTPVLYQEPNVPVSWWHHINNNAVVHPITHVHGGTSVHKPATSHTSAIITLALESSLTMLINNVLLMFVLTILYLLSLFYNVFLIIKNILNSLQLHKQ